jgi:uncharacterized protein (DUF302 family)
MKVSTTTLGMTVTLHTDFETARQRVIDGLKAEGFGVLTEIDVKDTLKKKLDVEFRPYRILGACNPNLAYQALTLAPEVGLLLPCNVTVAQADGDTVEISIVDPQGMMGFVNNPALLPIASAAREKLLHVAESLSE